MDGELLEPLALRWVEAGVSGMARHRDWDSVAVVEVVELAGSPLEELRFGVLADGTLVGGDAVPAAALERLAAGLDGAVRPPFEAVAVRRTGVEWSVAARELRIEEAPLPPVEANELVLAVGPDGTRTLLADGEEPSEPTPELEAASARLEEIGRRRHDAFVVRARRTVDGRWAISVDPL